MNWAKVSLICLSMFSVPVGFALVPRNAEAIKARVEADRTLAKVREEQAKLDSGRAELVRLLVGFTDDMEKSCSELRVPVPVGLSQLRYRIASAGYKPN
jgi:hypothetical protein